ncbi:MAG: ribosome assembly factor SBDS [Euryarchaeota archaeon]|nr:ribosome assembly factor SBDS [Euryarchaeota archaeon]
MVTLEKAIIARLESHGHKFEILVDPDFALKFKESKGKTELSSSEHLAIDAIFKDAKKGDHAGETTVKETFGTNDVAEVAKQILHKGEMQLTTEQRRVLQEQKRKLIVSTIVRNAINPQTGTPHPPLRIENAMDEAKVHVDPFKSVEEQVKEILGHLKPLIPIRFESVKVAVHLPALQAAKAYGLVKGAGTLVREEWQADGSWVGVVEMPAGMQTEFYDRLNEKTGGDNETKLVK